MDSKRNDIKHTLFNSIITLDIQSLKVNNIKQRIIKNNVRYSIFERNNIRHMVYSL